MPTPRTAKKRAPKRAQKRARKSVQKSARKTAPKAVRPKRDFPSAGVPAVSDCVLSRASPDGTLNIMRIDATDGFFSLSGPARRCWQLIDGRRSLERIQELVLEELTLPRERFLRDSRAMFGELLAATFVAVR